MRIGVSLNSTHQTDDHALGATWMIDRARTARDAGLDSLSLGDHHSMPIPYYQGISMLGRLAADWHPDRPIGCLFLLPLWNPVLVAEQVGTLGAIHPGAHFMLQTGIGDGADQFAAMNADLGSRGATLDESIRVIKALLAGETVDNERFGIAGARVNPRPPGGVSWWIGAGGDGPLKRAAREGDVWYGGPHVTVDAAPRMIDVYRSEAERLDRRSEIAIRKDVIILRDGDRATKLGDDMIQAGYRGMTRDMLAFGGVESVIEQLAPFKDLGVDEIVVRCMQIDQADALETLELAGEVRAALLG
jgi:alkanesulfonate monooxygenase SsuD/methylene tetrahydromethanopterin reductase-like flavin-dependent oxidoreductase (luciferase family)